MKSAAERACCSWLGRKSSPTKLFRKYRKSVVPEGGWTQEGFLLPSGKFLLNDASLVINSSKLLGVSKLTAEVSRITTDQFNDFIDTGMSVYKATTGRAANDEGVSDELLLFLWLLALRQTTSKFSMTFTMSATPIIQSVVDGVYVKLMELLGVSPNKSQLTIMLNKAKDLAQSLRYINNTIEDRITEVVRNSVGAAASMQSISTALQDKKSFIVAGRVGTIGRTEVTRATNIAAVSAYKDSGVVSHVSVIGCEAVEPGIPEYRGIPTCNIKNVPIQDAGKLEFHPNHTGRIVPAAFFYANGSAPRLAVSRG